MKNRIFQRIFFPTESGPPEKCQDKTWTFALVLTLTLALLFLIGALCFVRCKQVGAIVI